MELFLHALVIAGTPLLFATLGEILTEKAGNLNLGVEGLMLLGAVFGFGLGIKTSNPVIAILASMIAGSLGSLLYAILTVTLKANQVVTGLSITIFGTGVSSFIGQNYNGLVLGDTIKKFFKPIEIPILSKIPLLGHSFFNHDILVYTGYLFVILIGIYLYNTKKGLNLIMVGENTSASDASGINVTLYKYVHILLGGALCGLAGAYLSIVYVPSWQDSITAGRGWIAVALVIFSAWNPYKAIIGAYLFGGLDILCFRLQSLNINISQYLIDMLPYIVTIIVLILTSKSKNNNKAPKNLSIPYFREER